MPKRFAHTHTHSLEHSQQHEQLTHTQLCTHTHTLAHAHTHTRHQLLISDLESITRQTRGVWLAADVCSTTHTHTHTHTLTHTTHTLTSNTQTLSHQHTHTHIHSEPRNNGTHYVLTHAHDTHTQILTPTLLANLERVQSPTLDF